MDGGAAWKYLPRSPRPEPHTAFSPPGSAKRPLLGSAKCPLPGSAKRL